MKKKKKFRRARQKKKNYTIWVAIILVAAALAFYLNSQTSVNNFSGKSKCYSNSQCDWKSTNCCSENAGASWGCVNLKNFSVDCSGEILCPQVISPKPKTNCVCEQGSCTAK